VRVLRTKVSCHITHVHDKIREILYHSALCSGTDEFCTGGAVCWANTIFLVQHHTYIVICGSGFCVVVVAQTLIFRAITEQGGGYCAEFVLSVL
jgi:hypothetical protein